MVLGVWDPLTLSISIGIRSFSRSKFSYDFCLDPVEVPLGHLVFGRHWNRSTLHFGIQFFLLRKNDHLTSTSFYKRVGRFEKCAKWPFLIFDFWFQFIFCCGEPMEENMHAWLSYSLRVAVRVASVTYLHSRCMEVANSTIRRDARLPT